ncbi:MAG: hypothetical protein Q4G33_13390 [bacterium]|nr:hypothetical protein [bacterium]
MKNKKLLIYFLVHIIFLYLTYPYWIQLFHVLVFYGGNPIFTAALYVIFSTIFMLINTIIIFLIIKKNEITTYTVKDVFYGNIAGLGVILALFFVFKFIEGGLNQYPYHNTAFLPFLSGDFGGKVEDIMLFGVIMIMDLICYSIALNIYRIIKP